MLESDKPEMARILIALAEIKPGGKITPAALDLWFSAMADWTLAEFREAAGRLMRSEQFFPNPWHFEQLRKQAGAMTAGEAWAAALEHVRRGRHHYGGKAAPEIERAVRAIGGWRVLGHTPEDELRHVERRFAQHFAEISEAADVREDLPALAADNPVRAVIGRLLQ